MQGNNPAPNALLSTISTYSHQRTSHACCRCTRENRQSAVFTASFDQYYQSISVSEAITGFIRHLQASGRAANTIACYKGCLKRLEGTLKVYEAGMVTTADLEDAVASLQEKGFCSEVTLNKIRSVYRSFFQWLFETGRIARNPAARLSLAICQSLPTIPITMAEVATFLDTIRNSGDRNAARDELLFTTYAFAGIRRSEALSLKVIHYDPTAKVLHLHDTKGGNSRVQPVPCTLTEIAERYLRQSNPGGSSFLFPGNRTKSPLSGRQAHNRFEKWRRRAGIRESLTIHSFRSGFATMLYRTTGDIWLVARALGHTSVNATRRYIETDEEDIRRAIERTFSPLTHGHEILRCVMR